MASNSDVKELEAHLEAVREALARARTAMKEAASAERILTARIAELGKSYDDTEAGVLPSIEEPTILTTDHALRRTRKETLMIALAGAGVALGAAALTVVVVLALRPSPPPVPTAAPLQSAPTRPVEIPPPEALPEATADTTPPPAPPPAPHEPPRAAPAPKLEAPVLGAALKPADDCSTRYYYDAHGIKHYKPHCLGF